MAAVLKEATAKPRLSRMERRMQQRAANVGRARKMHDARLAAEKTNQTSELPKIVQPKKKIGPQYYIGCSGWFYWDWKGKFYPANMPTTQWFPHYAKNFKTVELNAPFYSWPTLATVRSWLRQAGAGKFVYGTSGVDLLLRLRLLRSKALTPTMRRNFSTKIHFYKHMVRLTINPNHHGV